MRGLGTIANTIAVLAGSSLGILLKSKLSPRLQEGIMKACGVAVLFVGAGGVFAAMLSVNGNVLTTQGSMLLILSLIGGTLIGEMIDIERRLDSLGEKLKRAAKAENDGGFVDAYVSSSLIICIGAMGIVGCIEDGTAGNAQTLYVKSVLDFIIVFVMAASMGKGVIFSALSIAVYQGLITLLAVAIHSYISDSLINNISYVGSVLIFAVGVNSSFGKKFRTGNMLPALIGPILYEIFLAVI